MSPAKKAAKREISGTVRLGGRTFKKGDEAKLDAAAEELDVEVRDRAFGVSSTELRPGQITRSMRAQMRAEEEEGGDEDDSETRDFRDVPLDGLAAELEGVTDLKELRRMARRDKRTGGKKHYQARIAALKEAEKAAESGDEGGE